MTPYLEEIWAIVSIFIWKRENYIIVARAVYHSMKRKVSLPHLRSKHEPADTQLETENPEVRDQDLEK